MEYDEEQPVDGAEAGRQTPQDHGEKTCHGGEGDVVAAKPAVEHDPMVTTGAGAGRSEAASDDAETTPSEIGEQSATDEERARRRGGDDPNEGGRDASGKGRPEEPVDVPQNERDGCEHAGEQEGRFQRGDRPIEGSGIMASEEAADGARDNVNDEDSRRDIGSLETSWDADGSEHEDAASKAPCSTDCSWPRLRVHAAGRTTLGKRDSGQRDPIHEHSPKRSRAEEATDTNGRMYINVDVPGGPKEDGAPHWGYVVSAPQRANRFLLCCPVHVQRSGQGATGAVDGRDSPQSGGGGKMASKKGRARTIHRLLWDVAVFVREPSGGENRQTTAEESYVHVLQIMQNDDMQPWDVSPTGDTSPTRNQDGNPDRGWLTVDTASKGLGLAGKVQVP